MMSLRSLTCSCHIAKVKRADGRECAVTFREGSAETSRSYQLLSTGEKKRSRSTTGQSFISFQIYRGSDAHDYLYGLLMKSKNGQKVEEQV